ncbi:efflux RND transporter periplasmic adaptor subunit [Microvirga sp. TS319]|uniref:efflux RND transporter periplasmic adaptor subunit n=1 Tax=Microvirga sp. TS319 TaxID=3241165 RepID=UPI00351A3AFE
MKKVTVAFAVIGIVAMGAGAARYMKNDTAQAVAQQAAPAVTELARSETFAVRKADLRFTVPLAGTLRPIDQTTLKSDVAAKVSEVLVQEGQPVRKGDVLVRLDTTDLTSRLNERVANLESAKAQLALAEKNRSMKLSLQQKGYAAQASVDEVESVFRSGQANVRAMQAQVDLARKALDDAVVRAPMDGFVSERAVNPGDKVPVDGKLVVLIDLARLEIEAPVPTNEIARVAVGQKALFRVPGLEGREFEGRVERINPTTKAGSRSIPAYIRVENADMVLRGGMFASGDIVVREVGDVIAVPPEVLRGDQSHRYVLKLDGDRIARQPVEVSSDATATLVAVNSGLSEGDTVVSAPSILLEPGTPVRIGDH